MKIIKILFFLVMFLPLQLSAEICTSETELVVVGEQKRLYLCEGGKTIKSFKVALGRNGLGKKLCGDRKTPIGEYPLGNPRKSHNFGLFIPVEYPTPKQQAQGYTGYAVGIHGPYYDLRWLGRLNTWINWTAGCVAVSSDEEISQIVTWVQKQQAPVKVRILQHI